MSTETQTDPSLMVPDEPGVYWCAKHRKVKTRLRCGRCERPICPKCTIMGPTGARCPECASNRHSHMYQVKPHQFVTSFLAAVIMGAIGSALAGLVGYLVLFFASAVGPAFGRVITKITHGKRGPALATVVSIGIVIGAFLSPSKWWMWMAMGSVSRTPIPTVPGQPPAPQPDYTMVTLLMMSFADPWMWIFIALAIGGVWWWLK